RRRGPCLAEVAVARRHERRRPRLFRRRRLRHLQGCELGSPVAFVAVTQARYAAGSRRLTAVSPGRSAALEWRWAGLPDGRPVLHTHPLDSNMRMSLRLLPSVSAFMLSLAAVPGAAQPLGEPSGTGPYPAVAEARPELPGHTVYRPVEW